MWWGGFRCEEGTLMRRWLTLMSWVDCNVKRTDSDVMGSSDVKWECWCEEGTCPCGANERVILSSSANVSVLQFNKYSYGLGCLTILHNFKGCCDWRKLEKHALPITATQRRRELVFPVYSCTTSAKPSIVRGYFRVMTHGTEVCQVCREYWFLISLSHTASASRENRRDWKSGRASCRG